MGGGRRGGGAGGAGGAGVGLGYQKQDLAGGKGAGRWWRGVACRGAGTQCATGTQELDSSEKHGSEEGVSDRTSAERQRVAKKQRLRRSCRADAPRRTPVLPPLLLGSIQGTATPFFCGVCAEQYRVIGWFATRGKADLGGKFRCPVSGVRSPGAKMSSSDRPGRTERPPSVDLAGCLRYNYNSRRRVNFRRSAGDPHAGSPSKYQLQRHLRALRLRGVSRRCGACEGVGVRRLCHGQGSQQLQGHDRNGTGPRSGGAMLCGPVSKLRVKFCVGEKKIHSRLLY
jgi:hypothetical protein